VGCELRLVERDKEILRELDRWSFCLSRHLKFFGGYSSQRACDGRLKQLREAGYIDRKRILYGVPSVYFLTYKGKALLGASKRLDKIKVEQITHDIAVLDAVIYFMLSQEISLSAILSEKQMHGADGFGIRKHRPDFIFYKDGMTNCVEVELSRKTKGKLEENLKQNFETYELQNWVVPKGQVKIWEILQQNDNTYPNIYIVSLEEVEDYIRNYSKPE